MTTPNFAAIWVRPSAKSLTAYRRRAAIVRAARRLKAAQKFVEAVVAPQGLRTRRKP